jgi:hypothetical protein
VAKGSKADRTVSPASGNKAARIRNGNLAPDAPTKETASKKGTRAGSRKSPIRINEAIGLCLGRRRRSRLFVAPKVKSNKGISHALFGETRWLMRPMHET